LGCDPRQVLRPCFLLAQICGFPNRNPVLIVGPVISTAAIASVSHSRSIRDGPKLSLTDLHGGSPVHPSQGFREWWLPEPIYFKVWLFRWEGHARYYDRFCALGTTRSVPLAPTSQIATNDPTHGDVLTRWIASHSPSPSQNRAD
jgi:hypothetical protein